MPKLNLKWKWLAIPFIVFLTARGNGQSPSASARPSPSPSNTSASVASPSPTPETRSTAAAIPLPEVIDRAEDASRFLQGIYDQISQAPEPEAEERELKTRQDALAREAQETERILASTPNMSEFWRQEQIWAGHYKEYGETHRQLDRRAVRLTENLRLLDSQLAQWQATLQQTTETDDLKEVFDRIRSSINQIQTARDQVVARQRKLLSNRNLLSQHEQLIGGVLYQIKTTKLRYEDSLFVRDYYPLWDARAYKQNYETLKFTFGGAFFRDIRSSFYLISLTNFRYVLSVLLFFLAVVFLIKLRKSINPEGEEPDARLAILRHPVAMALPVLLFSVILFTPSGLPLGVISLLMLLFLFPILRITPLLIEPSFMPMLYSFLAFFLVDFFRKSVSASPIAERLAMALETALAIALFAWPAFKLKDAGFRNQSTARKIAAQVIWLDLTLLVVSLAANVLGNLTLSEIILEGALFSAFSAIVFLTGVRAAIVVLDLVLKKPIAERLAFVRIYKESIRKWAGRALSTLAFLIWIVATLEYLTIRESVFRAVEQALKQPLVVGELQISVWGVLFFFSILICGVLLARATRFILKEEILERLPLRQGLPNAVSTVVYYLIMMAMFVLLIAAAGVELSRFTVLTGALGVGIGIGLQNIVNNFVSGIILLFERPIRLHDIVEIDGMKGEVKHIGARATIMMTQQGAEAIIPNAQLVSNRFVNWTLSNRNRRIELPVCVSYEADLQNALRILEAAARSHRLVLRNPPPSVDFIAFGDHGMLFEVRFWLPQNEGLLKAKSEVAESMKNALKEAGIEIPFPQLDLRMREGGLPGGVEKAGG